jgi:hypothetical protein
MSKEKGKGNKNIKKAPADKTKGLGKAPSAYKAESKSGSTLTPKSEPKSGGKP